MCESALLKSVSVEASLLLGLESGVAEAMNGY
jgi:hypothetical protein